MFGQHLKPVGAVWLVVGIILNFAPLSARAAEPLDGIWISDGYGRLLEIKGEEIKISEITAISCLPDHTAKRQPKPSDGAEAVFVLVGTPLKIMVFPGTSPDHKFFRSQGAASSIGFRRISQRPAVCAKKPENTPLSNFDIFWTSFDEHYPFFAIHGVNWSEVREKYRPMVTDKTTPKELFAIFKEMIEPLHDAHVSLRGASERFHSLRADTKPIDEKTASKIKGIVESNYLNAKLQNWCNDQVSYGLLPDSIGYLRITAFAGYSNRPDFDEQVKRLETALDKAFEAADKLRGLIIDVRLNHGGSDVLGVVVASRLSAKEYLAFAKKARNDPADPSKFTALQNTMVLVSPRPHFYGKVVLLTGSNTVSAGETFTMALMGRTPPVVKVGENTQGVFSDVLGRKLPNGFRFALPNEIFLTEDGKSFDGPGIPPDVPVEVFPKQDLDRAKDRGLEKAVEILKAG